MTKQQPLVLENCRSGHRVNLNLVHPYLAVAALTAAIMEEAGDYPLTMQGNDLHWRKFLEHGRFLGQHLEKIAWGAPTLREETVIRARWPADAPLRQCRTAGVHLKKVRIEGTKECRHVIVLTKINPKESTPRVDCLCGRMDLPNAQRLVEKANICLHARG